ncbi:MAG: hypothetical protein H7145_21820 [Akkermansiaceae bacterium]|nr:hypothetical protein [Armatimonadota bacterium]
MRYREARTLYECLRDSEGVARARMREGNALMETGRYAAAYPASLDAVCHFPATGDEPNLLTALFYSSMSAALSGDLSGAQEQHDDAVAIADSLGDRFRALLQQSSVNTTLTLRIGDRIRDAPLLADCARHLRSVIAAQRGLRDALGTTYLFRTLANLAARRGDARRLPRGTPE